MLCTPCSTCLESSSFGKLKQKEYHAIGLWSLIAIFSNWSHELFYQSKTRSTLQPLTPKVQNVYLMPAELSYRAHRREGAAFDSIYKLTYMYRYIHNLLMYSRADIGCLLKVLYQR